MRSAQSTGIQSSSIEKKCAEDSFVMILLVSPPFLVVSHVAEIVSSCRKTLVSALSGSAYTDWKQNIQPDNEASRRLVQRLGVRFEGVSPRYLRIAGEWCDYER